MCASNPTPLFEPLRNHFRHTTATTDFELQTLTNTETKISLTIMINGIASDKLITCWESRSGNMDSSGGNDREEEGPLSEREGNTSSRPSPPSLSKTTPRKNDLAFPMRLHEMIQWVESNYPDSSCPIYWLSSGRAFIIRDHDALTTV